MQEVPQSSPEARRSIAGHTTIADLTKRISSTSTPDQAALAAQAGLTQASFDQPHPLNSYPAGMPLS